MPHYVAVQIIEKDADAMAEYRSKAVAALAKHGGTPIAGGPESSVLEDTGAGPATAVLISFPDGQSAKAWMDDPELAATHALRHKAAQTMITLLPPLAAT